MYEAASAPGRLLRTPAAGARGGSCMCQVSAGGEVATSAARTRAASSSLGFPAQPTPLLNSAYQKMQLRL